MSGAVALAQSATGASAARTMNGAKAFIRSARKAGMAARRCLIQSAPSVRRMPLPPHRWEQAVELLTLQEGTRVLNEYGCSHVCVADGERRAPGPAMPPSQTSFDQPIIVLEMERKRPMTFGLAAATGQ